MKRCLTTVILGALILFPAQCGALKVGIVSDIHAGKQKKRTAGTSVIYPKKAVRYFERAVKKMQSKGVDLIISLGDTTNKGKKKYYKQLKKIEKKYGIKVLWVKGNHDDRDFSILGPENYVYELNGMRFVVINTSDCPKRKRIAGCMKDAPPKGDIYLQHHAPLIKGTCDWRDDFKNGKSDVIWSGHWHKEITCGNIKIFPALTEHKQLQYRIITIN